MDCTALTHAQISSRTVSHISPETAVYEKVPDPVISHGKPARRRHIRSDGQMPCLAM